MNLHEFIYVVIFAFLLEGGNSLRKKNIDNLNPVERGERTDQTFDIDINSEKSCSRERSKTVRDIFQKKILPFYEDLSPDGQMLEVPRGCPFNQLRDMYGEQERYKTLEYPSRWVCEYCGKAFSSEYFLDLHFDNRHREGVSQEKDRTCLADYCDIFRCDVVSGARKLGYWDKALCKPSDWSPIYDKCEAAMKACVPLGIKDAIAEIFYEGLTENVCAYLTCEKFWSLPEESVDNSVQIVTYVFLGSFLIVAVLFYYYVVYTHYYTDESLVEYFQKFKTDEEHKVRSQMPEGQEIRHRHVNYKHRS